MMEAYGGIIMFSWIIGASLVCIVAGSMMGASRKP
jgi:hypothetical protein